MANNHENDEKHDIWIPWETWRSIILTIERISLASPFSYNGGPTFASRTICLTEFAVNYEVCTTIKAMVRKYTIKMTQPSMIIANDHISVQPSYLQSLFNGSYTFIIELLNRLMWSTNLSYLQNQTERDQSQCYSLKKKSSKGGKRKRT